MRIFTGLLMAAFFLFAAPYGARAQDARSTPCVGDYGCKHDELHPLYQAYMANKNCHCSLGECRPTRFQTVGGIVQALIDGKWYNVPATAWRSTEGEPDGLLAYDGHICATKSDPPTVECAVNNGAT